MSAAKYARLACPKEAIKTQKQPKVQGEKAKKAKVDIDLAKCNFCGICDVTCPYGAIKVTLNGEHDLSILAKESYPQLSPRHSCGYTQMRKRMCRMRNCLPTITNKNLQSWFRRQTRPRHGSSHRQTRKNASKSTLTSKKITAQPAEYANSNAVQAQLKVKKAFEGKISHKPREMP